MGSPALSARLLAMTRWFRILMFALVLAAAGACGDDSMDDGGSGDGSGSGSGSGMGGDGDGMDGTGGGGGGGGGPGADPDFEAPTDGSFLSVCTPGEEGTCMDGFFCFEFNSKGPHCSTECIEDVDCAEPSTGCNGMGICKVP